MSKFLRSVSRFAGWSVNSSFLFILIAGSFQASALGADTKSAPTEEQLRLQVFLDQRRFRPGKLDGQQGDFTNKALLRAAQAITGGNVDQLRQEAQSPSQVLFTEYAVQESDLGFVGEVPTKPAEMAKLKFTPYRTLSELIAERYHTDQAYLRQINPGVNVDLLTAGARIKVPSVDPFLIESLWKNSNTPLSEPKSSELGDLSVRKTREVRIHRADHILEVWEADRIVASFPVSVGPPENETPPGEHSIKHIAYRPDFRRDEKMLKEGVRGEKADLIPAGPNNFVGVIWVQTSHDGIGIHGTNDPDLIGRNISSGCIRLSNWDVVTFSQLIAAGCKVVID